MCFVGLCQHCPPITVAFWRQWRCDQSLRVLCGCTVEVQRDLTKTLSRFRLFIIKSGWDINTHEHTSAFARTVIYCPRDISLSLFEYCQASQHLMFSVTWTPHVSFGVLTVKQNGVKVASDSRGIQNCSKVVLWFAKIICRPSFFYMSWITLHT